MNLEDHPTVRLLSKRVAEGTNQQPAEALLDGAWLRRLALDLGADDAGLVEIARPGLDPQREEILRNYPWTKSLLSIVLRMAREPLCARLARRNQEAERSRDVGVVAADGILDRATEGMAAWCKT